MVWLSIFREEYVAVLLTLEQSAYRSRTPTYYLAHCQPRSRNRPVMTIPTGTKQGVASMVPF